MALSRSQSSNPLKFKSAANKFPLREREKTTPGGETLSCADGNETRTHPPAGCGTTFELHWKAVENLLPPPCLIQRPAKFSLNFLNGSRRTPSRPVSGEGRGRGQTHLRHRHKRALSYVRKKRKFRQIKDRLCRGGRNFIVQRMYRRLSERRDFCWLRRQRSLSRAFLNALWTGARVQTVPKRTHLSKSSMHFSEMELCRSGHMANIGAFNLW